MAVAAAFALAVTPSLVAPTAASAAVAYDPFFAVPVVAADLGVSKAYGVAPGDFDGDGDGDLVIGRATTDTGGVSFAAPTTIKDYGGVSGRPFGVASADFDHDGISDLIVGRTTASGTVDFHKGVGNGTYAAAAAFPWRLEGANAFGLTAGDLNGDGWADLVFGATVDGCTVAFTAPATCTSAGGTFAVRDGEVRVLLNAATGAAATMFTTNSYVRSGITFAAGTLMARIAAAGIDVGSVAAADVDGNGRDDVAAGGLDGAGNTVVKVIRSNLDGTYTLGAAIVTQSSTPSATAGSPVYFAATNPAVSPWGLAFADMNGDGRRDLLVGDRGMYVYEYLGDGAGGFVLQTGFTAESGRPNALLSLSAAGLRDALGNTASLGTGDLNGDGRPDVVLGMNSGSQSASNGAHDGNVAAALSSGVSGYSTPAVLTDVDFSARGVTVVDANGDGLSDIVWGSFAGKLSLLTQVAPVAPEPNVYFAAGNGSGGYAAPTPMPWILEAGNSADLTPADVNHDGDLDLVYGATADGVAGGTVRVTNGDVRVLYGNGDGTFVTNGYTRAGGTYAAGSLLARVGPTGSTASSIAVGDVDGDTWPDVAVGGLSGADSVVQVIRNNADGTFTLTAPIISQPTATTTVQSPIYWPVLNPSSTPWGLAFGDADNDGDADLFVGDRGQYVYRYDNDGSGAYALHLPGDPPVDSRPNVTFALTASPDLNFTPALAAGDFNGDARADVAVGLYSAVANYAGTKTNDGGVYLGLSGGPGMSSSGLLADVGTQARGLAATDVNDDGAVDLLSGSFDGKVSLIRQLPPLDTDSDGISDYVDNAPTIANAPRIDMNTDGSYNAADQLDNDFDTVLGNPEDASTWQRRGDPIDPDDDNDGDADGADNCVFTANADQADKDGDGRGDACDPLFDSDVDGDGVPAFDPDDPLFAKAQAAAARWSEGDTHFVIRIDALGRLFQNEFTGLMSDAAISSPATWAAKCQGMYTPGTDPDPGCGSLGGGKEVPLTTVVIPRLLWTDAEVVDWMNDRNDNPLFEIGQHGTYHNSGPSNTMLGDWKDDPNKNFYSCDTCGLTLAESYELLKVGRDTLLGNYGNKWLVDSGATGVSPKVDWSSSANPLISYAPPFNTSDTTSRDAIAQLGYKAFSASVFEEGHPTPTTFSSYFTPEGSHHEQFDQFGVFHASADLEFDPIEVPDESYDQADREDFADHLAAETQDGQLNTWLIEEVEWSGRPCNEVPRLTSTGCNGGTNRENNTVYGPRWEQWLQLLDYVKSYPGGVAMTMGEVALAKAFDNAPTVSNSDQADSDHDGVGDVVEAAALTAADTTLTRNVAGSLTATLANGGTPLPGQDVVFTFDADGNGSDESYPATTGAGGSASVTVVATRDIGLAGFSVSWDGVTTTASDTGTADVGDATTVTLDAGNPATGQVTDAVSVGATLKDSDGVAVEGRTLTFTIGGASGSAATDANGHAQVSLILVGPATASTLEAAFAGGGGLGTSSASQAFTIAKESTSLGLAVTAGPKSTRIVAATLSEIDGARLAGRTITFETTTKVRGHTTVEVMGSAVTDGQGVARFTVPARYLSSTPRPVTARFAGDASYLATSASTTVTR